MITDEGKLHYKQYQAGIVGSLVSEIAFGIGDTAATTDDVNLEFEVDRSAIDLVSLDHSGDHLILKASIPSNFTGTITEVGVFSNNTVGVVADSRLLAAIDPNTETWLNGGTPATFVTGNSRLGSSSLQHTPAASGNTTSSLDVSGMDLSGYFDSDVFSLAYWVGNSRTSNIQIRFETDSANYYNYSLGAQTVGYKVNHFLKGTASISGAPTWSNITTISITTLSTSGGASDVRYDGLRLEQSDPDNRSTTLFAREVLDTPYVRDTAKTQDVEFLIGL